MKYIRNIKLITPSQPNGRTIVYMLGYGGYIWQAKRHLNLLKREGYKIIAIDFIQILRTKNPQSLVDLMDETAKLCEDKKLISRDTLMVGISMGGLVGFNLLKRYAELNKLLVITGGDMTHLPSNRSLKNDWKITRDDLSKLWQDVNIYVPVGEIKDKHVIMLLPKRDKVINPDEVTTEFAKHSHLNDVTLVNRKGGHLSTIITETIVAPKRSLEFIDRLYKSETQKTI